MRHRILAVAACTGLCAATASASFVIGNLGDPPAAGTAFGPPGVTTVFKAAGFTMNPGSPYSLDDVQLRIDSVGAGGASATVEIWSGAAGPTAFLSAMNGPAFVGDGVYTFTPNSAVTLNPGQTYWVYLDNTNPVGNFVWDGSTVAPAGPLASNAGYIFNGNPSSFLNAYEVNATLIPAPAGAALFGACGLLAMRRRRS